MSMDRISGLLYINTGKEQEWYDRFMTFRELATTFTCIKSIGISDVQLLRNAAPIG